MRLLIQRVRQASVTIAAEIVAQINTGLLILIGIETTDTPEDADWLAIKVAKLRIFSDPDGQMNLDLQQADGALLVVSQFTLHASTRKGNRPSYIRAARPEQAIPLYQHFLTSLANQTQRPIQTGRFGADMQVALINDGPVTIWIDFKNKE
jgi:D-aminoacyl-tRNA deacylase